MKKKNVILLLIIVFLALLLLSSCTQHEKILLIIELRLKIDHQDIEDIPLAGFSFHVMGKEYTTDENGFASVYSKTINDAYSGTLCIFPAGFNVSEPIVNNIYNTVFLTFYLEIIDYVQNPPQTEIPDHLLMKKLSLAPTRQNDNYAGEIRGYVMDTDYNRIEGVNVYFGEEPAYAGKTNAVGEFSLFFINAYQYEGEKIKDFIYFANDDYTFKVFLKSESFSLFVKDVEVFVVAVPKDSDFDTDTIIAPLYIRCSFDHSGVILPPGYKQNEREEYAVEGQDVIIGVELYLNGKLVSISNLSGFNIDFLIPGTLMQLKKESFSFVLRYNMGFLVLENDSYTVQGHERALLEFRGRTDNMKIFSDT